MQLELCLTTAQPHRDSSVTQWLLIQSTIGSVITWGNTCDFIILMFMVELWLQTHSSASLFCACLCKNRTAESGVLFPPTSPLLLVVPALMQQGPLLFEPPRPNNFSHSDLTTVALMTFNGLGYFLHSEKKWTTPVSIMRRKHGEGLQGSNQAQLQSGI